MIADRKRKQAQTALQYEQRFNVALSRARDRMILVRSVSESDLNPKDLKARLFAILTNQCRTRESKAELIDLCQSGFERDLFEVLVERGYRVVPQVGSEGFSIDMVVEGELGRRLAIECDGDRYHGPENGPTICASADIGASRLDLLALLRLELYVGQRWGLGRPVPDVGTHGIAPVGMVVSSAEYTEHRVIRASGEEARSGQENGAVGVVDDSEANVADGVQPDANAGLLVGDRIIIRYLDDPRSRQECYILTDKANDQLNGLLSLSSPLSKALSEALPGDEVSLSLVIGSAPYFP